ncbi:MAG: response regulator transcription factor [Acidobacteriales bacterium]|nr:response regulator transcription factor [Terriglobales bacterium]
MEKPTVVLADDLPQMREIVAQVLAPECDIVASVENGEQALAAVAKLDPDLVVLDISMPVLNGFQVASRLRNSACRAKVILLTVHEDRELIEAAFAVGAASYVFKARVDTDLLPAIQGALEGQTFASTLM